MNDLDISVGSLLLDMFLELYEKCFSITIERRGRFVLLQCDWNHRRIRVQQRDLPSVLFAALGEIERLEEGQHGSGEKRPKNSFSR